MAQNSASGLEVLPQEGAVKAIAGLVNPDVKLQRLDRGGQIILGTENQYDILSAPLPAVPVAMEGSTLSCIVDAFRSAVHGAEKVVVQVIDPVTVELVSPCVGEEKQRFVWARARANVAMFPFGKFLDVLSFIVMAQTTIVETEERKRVLTYVATMTNGLAETTVDDGVSQMITTKKGAATVGETAFANPVKLQPFRTFSEIKQPESPFILRIDTQGDPENLQGKPGLFLADGGAWHAKAIQDIAAFFRHKDQLGDGVTVVA